MDLDLARLELAQVGSVSHRRTLELFPPGKKRRQKFVVGDDNGVVTCFEMKREEPQEVYRCATESGSAIRALALNENAGKRDRVFAAQDQSVFAVKKGKQAFRLDAPLAEPINNLAVDELMIYAGCDFIYNLYQDGQDAGFHMCHDRVNGMAVQRLSPRSPIAECALACQDRCLRIMSGQDKLLEVPTSSPATAVAKFIADGRPDTAPQKQLLFGMASGGWGVLQLGIEGGVRKVFEVQGGGTAGDAVALLRAHDVTQDGVDDVVLTRSDGRIQVHQVAPESQSLVFTAEVGEAVQAVQCGVVNTPGYQEVVALTLSGKVISFSSEQGGSDGNGMGGVAGGGVRLAGAEEDGSAVDQLKAAPKIKALTQELEDLKKQVARERDRFAKQNQADQFVPTAYKFAVQSRVTLEPEAAAYALDVEIPLPLDVITLTSDVHLDLLEGGSSSAVVSVTPPPEEGHAVLATFRFQEPTTRAQIRYRTNEGESGHITLGVVAQTSGGMPKMCQVVKHHIKPLSLHHRISPPPDGEQELPWNVLELQGDFSISMAKEWISAALPEVPPRMEEESFELAYTSAYTGSHLRITCEEGRATIRSDSISTVVILRDLMEAKANELRVELNDECRVDDGAVATMLERLDPKLQSQMLLARRVSMIEAVKELSMQEQDSPWMDPEYRYILENADTIREEWKARPRALQYLSGVLTDLYVDWHKCRGRDMRHFIPQLQEYLARPDYTLAGLQQNFMMAVQQ